MLVITSDEDYLQPLLEKYEKVVFFGKTGIKNSSLVMASDRNPVALNPGRVSPTRVNPSWARRIIFPSFIDKSFLTLIKFEVKVGKHKIPKGTLNIPKFPEGYTLYISQNEINVKYTPKTGDIILFTGNRKGVKLIKLVTQSEITHCAIIVRHEGEIYIFESTVQYPEDAHEDLLSKKKKKDGVMMIKLKDRLETYPGNSYIRPLNKQYKGKDKIMAFYKKYQHKIFESNIKEMLNSQLKINVNDKPSLDEIFCSELIAQLYIELGWLSPKVASRFYVPREFESIQIKHEELFYLNKFIPLQ